MTGCSKRIRTGCRGFDMEPAVLGAASCFWSEEYRASLRTYSVDELLPDTGHAPPTQQPESEPGTSLRAPTDLHLVI